MRHLSQKEQRKYIRLDTVFPVQFRLIKPGTKISLSDWYQGFTNNVGKGGLCLSVNNLSHHLAELLKKKEAKLSLVIDLPLAAGTVSALTYVAWVRGDSGIPDKYLIGLSYDEIDPHQNRRIMRYALTKKFFLPVTLTIIGILALGFAANSLLNIKLAQGNKQLVAQLVKIIQESSVAKQKVKAIYKEKEDLQLKIQLLESRIQRTEEEKEELAKDANILKQSRDVKVKEFDNIVRSLAADKAILQEQLISVQHEENAVAEELLRLDKAKIVLEKVNFDKMYKWLKTHQNVRSGLVLSFEGDKDMANWAFLYDQSLAAQAFALFGDFDCAKKIFEFFETKAQRRDGLFFNAYYTNDEAPAEFVVHSGPNIWLGIAIVQYSRKSKDLGFLGLAEEIAQRVMKLQDKDGGITGGPNLKWYSTEHNLDAYALFTMLYEITGKAQYRKAAEEVLSWLVQNTYNKQDIPVARGKGDSTIATDTYGWSIAAIGPEQLEKVGMNPERIVEFAEQNCAVQVQFLRPDGKKVPIKGFDFASSLHLARGGIVSSEWTAQMILAFKIMEDYYFKKEMPAKARSYALKAKQYLSELGNMVITSPSPSGQGGICLPYATEDMVDTGHGWKTPQGKSTGSVAGTAYTLFAYYGYNPLELKE
ncbi:MAG: hypothetical protein KJ880_06865 [Candidatus Omnitrophica bacterium]|nr:hypothetical protein [Candidatus Omnitrophota bacterium]MBU1869369.1 hypothetical protein [Candidatus Omnitrophota bacterium]